MKIRIEWSEEGERREIEWEEFEVLTIQEKKEEWHWISAIPSLLIRWSEVREREEEEDALKRGLLKILVRFKTEGGVKKINLLKLTEIIRGQVGKWKCGRKSSRRRKQTGLLLLGKSSSLVLWELENRGTEGVRGGFPGFPSLLICGSWWRTWG